MKFEAITTTYYKNVLITTECTEVVEYYVNGRWKLGPKYPYRVLGHSAVAISDHEILSCGGDQLDWNFMFMSE